MALGRLGHFVKDMGGAVENVAKVGAFTANPLNAPKIASGVLKTGEFVAEHPGQTAHIAKEVGISMAKEQLKPQNLLITAGLVAATALTAGAAAPALAGAEAGMIGAEGGLAAAEGIEAGTTAAKAVSAGAEAVDAAATAGKAARATSTATKLGRAAEEVVEGGATGSKWAQRLDKVNEVRRDFSPIAQRTHAFRTAMGEKALSAGLEEGATAGPLRQAAANLIQGTGGIGPTTRMAGQSENFYRAQQQVRHVKQARSAYHAAQVAPEVASAVADPEGYAMKKAMQGIQSQKMGDTGEYQVAPGGRTVIPEEEGGPPSPTGLKERGFLRGAQKLQNFGAGVAASNSLGGANAFWKGPGREAFGGLPQGYDWRKFEQRGVNQVSRSSNFVEGGMMPPLTQPPAASPASTPKTPGEPPPMKKMATSPVYSQGTESATTPGPRIMPKAGSSDRGKADHSSFYGSGTTFGEDVDYTVGGTKAWNADTTGTMTFEPLEQPKPSSGRKGGIGDYGLGRINESLADSAPIESPLVPAAPIKTKTKKSQNQNQLVLGV